MDVESNASLRPALTITLTGRLEEAPLTVQERTETPKRGLKRFKWIYERNDVNTTNVTLAKASRHGPPSMRDFMRLDSFCGSCDVRPRRC